MQRMRKPTKMQSTKIKGRDSIFNRCFFCVKGFQPIVRVENNSQEKFTVLHVPHIGFLCYLESEEILL